MSITNDLKELLNDLCMTTIMLDAESVNTEADSIKKSVSAIRRLIESDSSLSSINPLLSELDKAFEVNDFEKVLELLKANSNSFQQLVDGKTNIFELVVPSKNSQNVIEVSPEADPELLIEFIEKHNSLLEELDGVVSEFRFIPEEQRDEEKTDDFRRYVKGYIHSIKGDAGSVGLFGIERVCHHLEDLFTSFPIVQLLDQIIMTKEWLIQTNHSVAQQSDWVESSTSFINRLSGTPSPAVAADPAPIEENNPILAENPHANLDLIAELLGEMESPAPVNTAQPSNALPFDEENPHANLDLIAELMGEMSPSPQSVKEKEPERVQATPPQSKQSQSYGGHQAHTQIPETYALEGDPELYAEFAVESNDHLGQMESAILDTEGEFPSATIDLMFRAIHSIKGASAYFKLLEVTEASHLTENLMDECRTGKRIFDQGLSTLCLSYIDLARSQLNSCKEAISTGGKVTRSQQTLDYLAQLNAYQHGDTPPNKPQEVTTNTSVSQPIRNHIPHAPAPSQTTGQSTAQAASGEKLEIKNFVKVETARLDQLIDSIGEMCIYSSMLIEKSRRLLADHPDILNTTHQVEKFSKELQNIGMSMRLIPIRGLFQKMSRLVWDTSKKIGKDIKFIMHGEDTELDRSIIDKLADPLMHMVRNSLDHGVEPPADRVASGKSSQGTVELSAYHAGGSIHIRIKDDGRGMDPEKLTKKAIEKGILAEGTRLPDSEAFQLIFAAGFSTAAQVTDISGRGVGMDVVRRNIESMRGRIRIDSKVGQGTTFTIELPLTLAIIDGIQVAVGKTTYIIPTLSVVELLRPNRDLITRTLDKGETYQFRGKYLPIYRLYDLFRLTPRSELPEEALFVVVETNGEQFIIMVDDVLGSYSTVIKSLGEMFQDQKGLAGCCVLSTGDVALILDVRSTLDLARESYTHMSREQRYADCIKLTQDEVVH